MQLIELIRLSSGVNGSFGVLLIDALPFCVTLELPYKQNAPQESCIPTGVYLCERITSAKFGETFVVQDVYKRSDILFHAGNQIGDSHGCILLGKQYGKLNNLPAIVSSQTALQEFKTLLWDIAPFQLRITNHF